MRHFGIKIPPLKDERMCVCVGGGGGMRDNFRGHIVMLIGIGYLHYLYCEFIIHFDVH